MNKISGVYSIFNSRNGKLYIGSSKNCTKRITTHKFLLRKGHHFNKHLQSSWNRHKETNFFFEVLEECEPQIVLLREQFWLDISMPEYNQSQFANSRKGTRLTESAKATISMKNKGLRRSEATKLRISKAKLDVSVHDSKSRANMALRMKGNQLAKGHKVSEESRRRMSIAKLGNRNRTKRFA